MPFVGDAGAVVAAGPAGSAGLIDAVADGVVDIRFLGKDTVTDGVVFLHWGKDTVTDGVVFLKRRLRFPVASGRTGSLSLTGLGRAGSVFGFGLRRGGGLRVACQERPYAGLELCTAGADNGLWRPV